MHVSGFDLAYRQLLQKEGGYSDNPHDNGGKTMRGITEHVARSNGYTGDMRDLSDDWARRIYRAEYWDHLRLDEVEFLSPAIAHELFDTGVNCGTGVALKFLQRALNAMNKSQSHYTDVAIDGQMGNRTLEALGAYIARRGPEGITVLMRVLNALQGEHYIRIAERREVNETFTYGWFLNRVFL